MIEEPPILTVSRGFERPGKELLAAFKGLPTGYAVDAMEGRGALDWRIKPLDPARHSVSGTALTCFTGPADNLALFAAISEAQPGDVIVCGTDSFTGTALTGDLLLAMAKNKGVAGLVTDGLARDLEGILEVGLPLFCQGISPNSPSRAGPGTIGEPVTVGGVRVSSGDIVVADRDGVVIVPQSSALSVVERLSAIRAAEARLTKEVADGRTLPDDVIALLESSRVRIRE